MMILSRWATLAICASLVLGMTSTAQAQGKAKGAATADAETPRGKDKETGEFTAFPDPNPARGNDSRFAGTMPGKGNAAPPGWINEKRRWPHSP